MCHVGSGHWCACRGHRTSLWSWFSPPAFMRHLGIDLKSLGFCSSHFYPLGHLPGPTKHFKIDSYNKETKEGQGSAHL